MGWKFKCFMAAFLSLVMLVAYVSMAATTPESLTANGSGTDELITVMDVQGNFHPSGWMGDYGDIQIDEGCTEKPCSGPDCLKIEYSADCSQGKGWAGIYWQYPAKNWGDHPGYRDLHLATKLIFQARGKNGGEKAEFKVGGIKGDYRDSINPAVTTKVISLTNEWTQYSIDLQGKDLNRVIGGFCWVTNTDENPEGCTIYVDNIKFVASNRISRLNSKPLFGLNFSPYLESQSPDQGSKISEEQIRMRLHLIEPFTQWVRTFSCADGLEKTGKIAHSMGLKTVIGAWIGKDRSKNEKEIESLIKTAEAGDADIVAVGNEVLLRGDLNEDELIKYIRKVKGELRKNNPKVRVTTVDGYYYLLKHPRVVEVCDVVLINCYPFWEGCRLENSIASLDNMYEKVRKIAGGKEIIISETGWPSGGEMIGNAIPSAANSQKYLTDFLDWAEEKKVKYFYFTGFDESWKAVHEGALGAYWGIFDTNGNTKYDPDRFSGISVVTLPEGSTLPVDGIFIPSGYMGITENIRIQRVPAKVGSDAHFFKIRLLDKIPANGWSGVYWQYPANNWGDKPGINLYIPKRLTFRARGEKGGEKVNFKVGGIAGDYIDSINDPVETGEIELTRTWKQYSLDLEGRDTGAVIGGFCCTATKENNHDRCVINISDMRFEW